MVKKLRAFRKYHYDSYTFLFVGIVVELWFEDWTVVNLDWEISDSESVLLLSEYILSEII